MKKAILLFLFCFSCVCLLTSCKEEHVHEFGEWITVKEATCTEGGKQERYCFCLEKEIQTTPIIEHIPGNPATCLSDQRCSLCGIKLQRATGHSYGEFVITNPATCKTNGSKEQTCSGCGDKIYKTIYAKGHKYGEFVTVKEATCQEPGLREKYCACGDTISETITIEHTGSWTVLKEPTKTENGFRELACSACHQTITETLYAFGSSGFSYWLDYTHKICKITGIGTCTDADVVIPEYIEGYKVTIISERAFENCQTMVTLTIPATVTDIGDFAVSGASNLKTLYYNASAPCNSSCFMNAPIKKIVYGGTAVFGLTGSVEEVVITENATSIETGAFSGCSSLKSIIIPDSVKTIGERAFSNCGNLETVILPAGLTSLEYSTFYACHALKSIVIPEGVTELGNMLFFSCNSLTSIVIPSTVTKIDATAFSGCSALTEIALPAGLTEIGDNAFSGCSALTSIVIPEGITVIGEKAFDFCTALTDISLPKGVTKIGVGAFYKCTSLKNITFGGTKADWEAISKGNDWKLWSELKTVTCSDGVVNV